MPLPLCYHCSRQPPAIAVLLTDDVSKPAEPYECVVVPDQSHLPSTVGRNNLSRSLRIALAGVPRATRYHMRSPRSTRAAAARPLLS